MLHHSLSKNRLRLSWAKHKISFIGVGDDVNIIGEVNTCLQIFKSLMFYVSSFCFIQRRNYCRHNIEQGLCFMFYLVLSNTNKYFHFHHCDALEERPVVDITIDRVYVLCFMCCIIYVKKFQEEGFRFYDLPLYQKKVLMIRNTCCGYKDGQSLCFKFYFAVLMIFRKTCC